MANDPNRDLLPVKDVDDRSCRGVTCRGPYSVISKLKRSDLEDRYMRLYEENTQIKKQLNCQDEKIKRLGTKLLRLIGDKKGCADSCGRSIDSPGLEELQMKIIELKHENFILKDKNVVLKQQLSNHARHHVAAHRSPNRSVHTSPRISHRQSSAPNVNETNYILSNRNQPHEQLREAEEHINGLNEEIKRLHNKIDSLQQDLEKSSLDNQKTKVCENIELIRLQRSLKQQSIQIATLQVQIKNSEKCQQLLRDELATAHKENEESLQVISDKQKEILDLYTKLEERSLSRLEQEEMRERINDLASERDSLRERGEFLMRTIEAKSSESEIVSELKKLLSVEKSKKEELKQSLENTQKVLQSLKESARLSQTSVSDGISSTTSFIGNTGKLVNELVSVGIQTTFEPSQILTNNKAKENELELLASTQLFAHPDNRRSNDLLIKDYEIVTNNRENGKNPITRSVGTSMENYRKCHCSKRYWKEATTQTQEIDSRRIAADYYEENLDIRRSLEAEKLNLERELEYVKQMLRSQTQRCKALEEEVNGLKSDLRVSEEKYNDTLRRLDLHLKIFRHLESRTARNTKDADVDGLEQKYLSLLTSYEDGHESKEDTASARVAGEEEQKSSGNVTPSVKAETSEVPKNEPETVNKPENSQVDKEGKLRFVERKFLDSSDEEDVDVEIDKEKQLSGVSGRNPKTSPESSKNLPDKSSKRLEKSDRKAENSDDEEYNQEQKSSNPNGTNKEGEVRPVPKPRTELSKVGGTSATGVFDIRGPVSKKTLKVGTSISICIEWLKLEPNTSVWYDTSLKLLFVDFSFLDVKGEETETPSSLKKPEKPIEKCRFNFTRSIEMTDYRVTALQALRTSPELEIIVFKVVSEPDESDESNNDGECMDIGVAAITVQQFFDSNPNASILLHVKNINDVKEIFGILSVRLDVSAIV